MIESASSATKTKPFAFSRSDWGFIIAIAGLAAYFCVRASTQGLDLHERVFVLALAAMLAALLWISRSSGLRAWSRENEPVALVLLGCFVVVYFWTIYFTWAKREFGTWEEAGRFGDSFGGFTALMTSLSFVGLLMNVLLQNRQLQAERARHADENARHDRELADERERRALSDARQLEQTRLMQEQLTALQEQRREERAQYLLSIEPRFSVRIAHAAPDCLRITVVNTGGAIFELTLVDDTARRVRLMDAPAVESGRESGILVMPPPAPAEEVEFELRYRRVADLGVAGQRFRLVGESSPRRVLSTPCAAVPPR